MRVNYLGPVGVGAQPAVVKSEPGEYSPSCYLVEVSDEAGVDRPVIEGDVLVVDEAKPAQHADLVVVEVDTQLRLFKSHRIGGGCRLLPANGGRGHHANMRHCRGVVVDHLRLSSAG